MRNARTKRIINQTDKYLLGPFDDSLVQIQLDKNEKCILEINKNNFQRAQQFLKQIKKDGQMISSYNREKYIVKCLTLNTQAYYYQKQNKFQEALRCLQESQAIELKQITSPIDKARTQLNKSVILSNLNKHQQAIQLAKKALQLLKNKKNLQFYEIHKNQYKLYQIMIISFHNIASSLIHLNDLEEANKLYKEGYYLGQKILGSKHKLTIMLKQIIKSSKKKKQNFDQNFEQNNDLIAEKSNRSLNKLKKSFNHESLSKYNRQEQLKRIYAYRSSKNSHHTTGKKSNKKTFAVNLTSLQKIKQIQNEKRLKFSKILRINTEIGYNSKLKSGNRFKSITEQSKNSRYNNDNLNNENNSFIITQLNLNKSNSKLKTLEKSPKQNKKSAQKLIKIPSGKIVEKKNIDLQKIVHKIEQTKKEQNSQCQLI